MKKGDFILIGFFLIFALGLLLYQSTMKNQKFNQNIVKISVDNELYSEFELSSTYNDSFTIHSRQGYNTVVINNGMVSITEADCPDKLCVQKGEISHAGDILVCLPNKLVIEIIGENKTEVDDISY